MKNIKICNCSGDRLVINGKCEDCNGTIPVNRHYYNDEWNRNWDADRGRD